MTSIFAFFCARSWFSRLIFACASVRVSTKDSHIAPARAGGSAPAAEAHTGPRFRGDIPRTPVLEPCRLARPVLVQAFLTGRCARVRWSCAVALGFREFTSTAEHL